MTGLYKEEFSRAFSNKRFWVVAFLAMVSFTYGATRVIGVQPDNPLDAVKTWQIILQRGSYGFFAALLAGLPFADSLLVDRRHHFIDQILLRSRYHQYLSAKILANLCAGSVAVAGPALMLLIGCCLFFPFDPQLVSVISFGIGDVLDPNVIEPTSNLVLSQPGFILLSLLMLALFGAAYALLGMGSSFIIRNPFIVLGFPFICYSLGYFIIPTSIRLAWLESTEAALLPSKGLFSPVFQYLAIFILFVVGLILWGRKDRMLLG
jgi:hypothetical protein